MSDDKQGQFGLLDTFVDLSRYGEPIIKFRYRISPTDDTDFINTYLKIIVRGEVYASDYSISAHVTPAINGSYLSVFPITEKIRLTFPHDSLNSTAKIFTVKNLYFASDTLRLGFSELRAPFKIELMSAKNLVSPGDSVEIKITLDSARNGFYRDTLEIISNAVNRDGNLRILLEGDVRSVNARVLITDDPQRVSWTFDPTRKRLILHDLSPTPLSVQVYNVLGRLVYTGQCFTSSSSQVIDCNDFVPGVYFVSLADQSFSFMVTY